MLHFKMYLYIFIFNSDLAKIAQDNLIMFMKIDS